MSYDVKIIADSIGPNGSRLTTFALRYPRMVHAELMTHRAFSRNASSTRAIPTAKMIEWIEQDPAMPVYWGKNQKGMQATEELSEEESTKAHNTWLHSKHMAVEFAKDLLHIGVHKQIASRILEPWAHINVVVTSTRPGLMNFFALRCHKAAMPEIQVLAVKMARAYRAAKPAFVRAGNWHLPFITDEDWANTNIPAGDYLKASVARCARVSYKTFEDKVPKIEEDIALHDMLLGNGHWSPFEHQAKATSAEEGVAISGNLLGWTQYRQTLAKGVHETFDFSILDEFPEEGFVT